MVLGLMDFLLGGKKKTKLGRNGQVSANPSQPMPQQGGAQVPDGVQNTTQNTQEMQFEDQNAQAQQQPQAQQQQVQQPQAQPAMTQQGGAQVQRKSVSEALSKIHKELKETNSRVTDMVASIKNVENSVNTLGHRVDELEASKKVSSEKFTQMDANMSKFLSLYELINNQYNPFVTQEEGVKKVAISSDGNSIPDFDSGSESSSAPVNVGDAISALPDAIPELKEVKEVSVDKSLEEIPQEQTPEVDENIDIDINPADLRIDVYRASGAGGQHVNTTDSAVRAVHTETGMSVRVETERSQHANKRLAKALLFQKLELMKQEQMTTQERARWQQHWEVERGNPVKIFKGERFTLAN